MIPQSNIDLANCEHLIVFHVFQYSNRSNLYGSLLDTGTAGEGNDKTFFQLLLYE